MIDNIASHCCRQHVTGINDPPMLLVPGAHIVKLPCEDEAATKRHVPVHRECDRIVAVDTFFAVEDIPIAVPNVSVELRQRTCTCLHLLVPACTVITPYLYLVPSTEVGV